MPPELPPEFSHLLIDQSVDAHRVAVQSVELTLATLENYVNAVKRMPHLPVIQVDPDLLFRTRILQEQIAYFVGAAGEVCEACGGSGRKPGT
jgi:hypothetical protein